MRTRLAPITRIARIALVALAVLWADLAGDARAESAERIAVVVHPGNPVPALHTEALRRIFLLGQTRWPSGSPITVLERPASSGVRQHFSRAVLGMAPQTASEEWLRAQVTKAVPRPRVLGSSNLLKTYLKRSRGAIGYLYEREIDSSVKVIALISALEQ